MIPVSLEILTPGQAANPGRTGLSLTTSSFPWALY